MSINKSILIVAISVLTTATVQADPMYKVDHLSGSENPMPPSYENRFVDINNNEQMLMVAHKAIPTISSVAAVSFADKWLVINQHDLPNKFPFLNLAVLDINNKGEVLSIIPTIEGSHGFVASFSKSQNNAGSAGILQSNRDLGNGVIGLAINDKSEIVGSYLVSDGNEHAFIELNGALKDLGTLGKGGYSVAYGINNCGYIVGESNEHAFVSYRGIMKDLGRHRAAKSVNNHGQIAGNVTLSDNDIEHAFLIDNGVFKDLGTFGGKNSSANKINAAGQVVGTAETADGKPRAFVTIKGNLTDLNELIDEKSLIDPSTLDHLVQKPLILNIRLENAISINDSGKIITAGYSSKGRYHTFMLTPTYDYPNKTTEQCATGDWK